jgi:flagellar FliJ protein
MAAFRFEALLTARRHAEEARQKELAEAQRRLAAEQAELAGLRDALRSDDRAWRRRQKRSFMPVDLQLNMAHLERLERAIAVQAQRVEAAGRQVRQRRQALIEAVKKRKILEKLKEKDRAAHARRLAERERKLMDELAGRGAARAAEGI